MLQKTLHLIEAAFQITTEFYARTIPRRPIQSLTQHTGIVAHRGLISHPQIKENTMQAFHECLKKNIWAIEFDVRFTKDLIPIVHHDPNTIRVWGKSMLIENINFEELRASLPQIPSLAEVAQAFGKKTHLMIELKKPPEFTESEMKSASYNLTQALKELTPEADYHFMSFQPEELILKFKLPSRSILSILTTNISSGLNSAIKWKLKGITGHFALITKKHRHMARQNNLFIGVGFINSKNSLLRELKLGADALYSNCPLQLQEIMNKIPSTNAQQ